MTLMSDCKEDLQYRMADLLQQLAQSEEERKKLEKTCNMLIRAFKEEEKLRYKALENKYEKFVEDCKIRKRRNDMILRSIHRVEDRARALHSKTERLKILKNRYINILKPLEFRKNEASHTFEKIPSTISSKSSLVDKETPKYVHWKTPSVADFLVYPQIRKSCVANISKYLRYEGYDNTNTTLPAENVYDFPVRENEAYDKSDNRKNNILSENHNEMRKENVLIAEPSPSLFGKQNEIPLRDNSNNEEAVTSLNSGQVRKYERPNVNESSKIVSNEEILSSSKIKEVKTDLDPNFDSIQAVNELKERSIVKHQESIEKLKTALSFEEESDDQKTNNSKQIIEKDKIENNEKQIKSDTDLNKFIKNFKEDLNYKNSLTSSPAPKLETSEDLNEEKEIEKELPKGLDGIDYENETYPESYYEQPVRQNNYSSIASNVILEEDEQEIDQLEVIETPTTSFINRKIEIHQNNYSKTENSNIHEKNSSDHSQKPHSMSASEDSGSQSLALSKHLKETVEVKSSDSFPDKDTGSKQMAGNPQVHLSAKITPLKHLLESDSESFQIEHGDVTSVNEDSDFDFSFNQN